MKAAKRMGELFHTRPKIIVATAIFAILFGALTIVSGGSVVFFDESSRAAGNYVPFVVWFNFLAGFAYLIAGIGLFKWRRWALTLSIVIAVATLLVFIGLGVHIMQGGAYEMRTVLAMTFRAVVWIIISLLANSAWKSAAWKKAKSTV